MNRTRTRSLAVSALATIGLLCGLVPDLSNSSSPLNFSSVVYAQDISDAELTNYARAILSMEPVRQEAYNQIKKLRGSDNIPPILCDKPETLDKLKDDERKIADQYCKESNKIVKNSGLEPKRFNAITINMQKNSDLKTRIQNELLRIQSSSQ